MSKPYVKLPLTEEEFKLLHGAAITAGRLCSEKLQTASDSGERAFLSRRVEEYSALANKFVDVLRSDKSQDAEPEPDEEEES